MIKNIQEYLCLSEGETTKLKKIPIQILKKAYFNSTSTEEKSRTNWDIFKRKAYFKACIKAYLELSKKTYKPFTPHYTEVIEGERFTQLKTQLDQQVAKIAAQNNKTHLFNCDVCGPVSFHSRLACWWRKLEKQYK